MPRLLLINPSNSTKGLGNMASTAFPPLNLPYIAALTPSNYEIDVIDENIEPFEFRDADIVGLTAYTASANRAYEISKIYRNKRIPTVMGGIHASMLPDEASNYCDVIAIGEAETIWPQILKDFENHNLKTRYKGGWIDLNELPVPKRDILNNAYYEWGSIQTSRGCPMNCSFCSVTAFNGRRFRRRPLDSVINEIETIPQNKILITDDNIIGYGENDKAWLLSFFQKIIEKKINKFFFAQASIQFGQDLELLKLARKAGLNIVFIGIESVMPNSLKSYSKKINLNLLRQNEYINSIKNIQKAGILLLGAFILGGDEEDISVFDTTLKFIQETKIDIIQACKLTPLPGTLLWDQLSNDNRLIKYDFPKAWDDFRFTTVHFKPTKMTIEEVYEGFAYLKKSYYSLSSTLRRSFSTLVSTKSIINTLIAFKLNQSYKKAFKNSENYYYTKKKGLKKKFQI